MPAKRGLSRFARKLKSLKARYTRSWNQKWPLYWVGALVVLGSSTLPNCLQVTNPSGPNASRDDGSGGSRGGDYTYYERVAPVVVKHCAGCHTAGGIAPFPLQTPEDVIANFKNIETVVGARTMPPNYVDTLGSCQNWDNHLQLTTDEMGVFDRWKQGGFQRGNPADAPEDPPVEALREVDSVLDIGLNYTPVISPDEYRCFLVTPQPDFNVTKYLIGYEAHPDNVDIDHHAIIYVFDSQAAQNAAEGLDAADPGPGYNCFGGPGRGVSAMPVAAWGPGQGSEYLPEGTGYPIAYWAGRKVLIQMHYNLAQVGSDPDDRTRFDLDLADAVSIELAPKRFGVSDFVLDPGEASTVIRRTVNAVNDIDIYQVFPHMHTLGKSMTVTYTKDGVTRCVTSVPRWNFKWQHTYRLSSPLRIPGGSTVTIECEYDTTSKSVPTLSGEQTEDEMCQFLTGSKR